MERNDFVSPSSYRSLSFPCFLKYPSLSISQTTKEEQRKPPRTRCEELARDHARSSFPPVKKIYLASMADLKIGMPTKRCMRYGEHVLRSAVGMSWVQLVHIISSSSRLPTSHPRRRRRRRRRRRCRRLLPLRRADHASISLSPPGGWR